MQAETGTESVVVFASGNWMEAEMVACALEGHEIPVFVIDDNVSRIEPRLAVMAGGVKVIVRLEDLEGARDVLQLAFSGDPPFVRGFETVPLSLAAALAMVLKRWGGRALSNGVP